MYQFLKGIITEKINESTGSERIILDVNGVGYEIFVSNTSLSLFGKKGEQVTVYTALIHREDQMTLFGFPTLIEREMFFLLSSVSGVGPKTAVNILDGLTVSEVCHAILSEDSSTLSKAQGIGAKTAQRIVLDLQQKVKNWTYLPIARSNKESKNGESSSPQDPQSSVLTEARSVLQSLGYSSSDINTAFNKANKNGKNKDSETLVHFSLKWLSTIKS